MSEWKRIKELRMNMTKIFNLDDSKEYINRIFDEYEKLIEQSNKREEVTEKYKPVNDEKKPDGGTKLTEEYMQYVLNKISSLDVSRQNQINEMLEVWECIDKMSYSKLSSEIETLKKQVEENKININKKIESICVGEKPVSEPKQERFNSKFNEELSCYYIYQGDIYIAKVFTENKSNLIIKALNSMEASKNDNT